ncbi:MAG: hydrogen peroxide-inducible genes activator [Bauldia sp.]|nr:hydrogen peroxide-inducible genes activator [Bauldia sp.]
MITTRQLRYFDALVRLGHFGRAADAVGVSQPALSNQIRELETLLGGPLLERGAAEHRLTRLGSEVAARTTAILASLRDLEELGRARGAVLSGPLALGIIPSVAPYLLPRLLPELAETYPDLRLVLREAVTASIVEELKAGTLDAIVASVPLGDPALSEAVAFSDRFLLAVPSASPAARANQATVEMIDADQLLLLADGHCLRDQALAVCGTIDPARLRGFGATSLATILQLVAAGQGMTLLPELAADAVAHNDARLRLLAFAAPEPGRTVGVAWRKGSTRERDFVALAASIGKVAT